VTERALRELAPLAPLHLPVALEWVDVCRATLGADVPQVAVFDTAFFAGLPDVAAEYALPRELARAHKVRRYGFHGLAHDSMWRRWRALRPELDGGGRLISIQLGAGCSVAAVAHGAPLDTSMGFSPLEGLVMATRSGDVDAAAITHLMRRGVGDADAIDRILNTESGLLGVSGMSGDMRELLASEAAEARLAVELYCYRARKYVGAYLAVLGGADGIAFGGGVGEHAPAVREKILTGMEWCGVALDRDRNDAARGGEARIGAAGAHVDVWVLAVDEAEALAREALALAPA
jgi:acetate kinase